MKQKLPETRVEIITSVAEAAAIPWELLRDPKTDAALALRAQGFVRIHTQAAQRPQLLQTPAAMRGRTLPQVSIGRPTYWPLDARLDLSPRKVQSDLAPADVYGLARFPFSLRPADDIQVKRVDFTVALYPSGTGPRPVAYDAHPPTTIVEREGEVTLSLGPDFKFAGAEASLAKVEGSIKLKQGVAAITVDGIGESDVRWVFRERAGRPLLGSLVVYVVVARPAAIRATRASVRLSASMNSRWGQLVGRLPETAATQLTWLLT